MKRERRAFVVVLAVFIMLVITIMGLAYISSGSLRYAGAVKGVGALQALAMAESGIEDARLKLEKDPLFPPNGGPQNKFFSYTETVTDVGSGVAMGSFEVLVDRTYVEFPYYVIRLTSTGRQGTENIKTVRAEIDVYPYDRTAPVNSTAPPPNPNLYQIINWTEEGLIP